MSSDIHSVVQPLWPRKNVLNQLSAVGRVLSITGPLMLDVLHEEIYKLKRYRQQEYGPDLVIDCFASRDTKLLLRSAMHDWYARKYGLKETFQIQESWDTFERYNIPSHSTMFAVFERHGEYNPILWFIDIANTTDKWEILEPNRHLAIVGFTGFGFKD